jgi:hypothetical protein
MTLSLKQKQEVLQAVKSTISAEPFSCLGEPRSEEEARNQFLELAKAFDVHPPGVMPQFGGYNVPGFTEIHESQP